MTTYQATFNGEALTLVERLGGDNVPWVVTGEWRCNGDGTMSATTYTDNHYSTSSLLVDTAALGLNLAAPVGHQRPFLVSAIPIEAGLLVTFPYGFRYPLFPGFYQVGAGLHAQAKAIGDTSGVGAGEPVPAGGYPLIAVFIRDPRFYDGETGGAGSGDFELVTDFDYDASGRPITNGVGVPIQFTGFKLRDGATIRYLVYETFRARASDVFYPSARIEFPAGPGLFEFDMAGTENVVFTARSTGFQMTFNRSDSQGLALLGAGAGGSLQMQYVRSDGGATTDPWDGALPLGNLSARIGVRTCANGHWQFYVNGALKTTAVPTQLLAAGPITFAGVTAVGFVRSTHGGPEVRVRGNSYGNIAYKSIGGVVAQLQPLTGEAPLEVTMTGVVDGGIVAIEWGDNSDTDYLTSLPLSHTFAVKGVYTVTVTSLVLHGGDGCDKYTFLVDVNEGQSQIIDLPFLLGNTLHGALRDGDVRFQPRGL